MCTRVTFDYRIANSLGLLRGLTYPQTQQDQRPSSSLHHCLLLSSKAHNKNMINFFLRGKKRKTGIREEKYAFLQYIP